VGSFFYDEKICTRIQFRTCEFQGSVVAFVQFNNVDVSRLIL